jgi:predicted negative regulator of RcsB-dependent stress response
MKQNEPQEYLPTKTFWCMMVVVFFAGVFILGEGVNLAWRQRTEQATAQQAQTSHQWDKRPMRADGKMKSQWRNWHFRRRHHHNREHSSKNKINTHIPISGFTNWE